MNEPRGGFQFRLLHLMWATACFAAWVGLLSYARPRHLVLLVVAPLVALLSGIVIGGVGLIAAGRGRWWMPLLTAAICFAAFFVGMWVQARFYP
jgi:hypothetical protein